MIRRTIQLPDGQTAWILIEQREHARLSAELSGWIAPAQMSARDVEQVEWAIRHHDDGWLSWDSAPSLDAEGRPLAFDEMSVADANPIWAHSIDAARQFGELSGYMVARHFLALRAQSPSAAQTDAVAFASKYEPLAEEWLKTWLATQPERRQAIQDAEDALERLRWADLLSLRLCGDLPETPVLVSGPGGIEQELSLVGAERLGLEQPLTYCLDPWPPMPLKREYQLQAHQVPEKRYADVQELKQAMRSVVVFGVLGRWDTWQ